MSRILFFSPSLDVLVPIVITHRQGSSPSLKSSHASKENMSSISTTSKSVASTGTSGSNSGVNSSKNDVVGVSAATSGSGRGEEPVMKTGNESSEISSENRQAIRSLLVSLQLAKPNQSVRSLITGDVGGVLATLLGLAKSPGEPEAMLAASLMVKLEQKGFTAYDAGLDRMVVLKSPATGMSSEASTASRTTISSLTSSQSGGESKGTEERDADSAGNVAATFEEYLAWLAKGPPAARVAHPADVVSNVEARAAAHASGVEKSAIAVAAAGYCAQEHAAIPAAASGTGDVVESSSRAAPIPPARAVWSL